MITLDHDKNVNFGIPKTIHCRSGTVIEIIHVNGFPYNSMDFSDFFHKRFPICLFFKN